MISTLATRLLPLTVKVCAGEALPIIVLNGPPGTSEVVVITGGGTITLPDSDMFCVVAPVDVSVSVPFAGPKGAAAEMRT